MFPRGPVRNHLEKRPETAIRRGWLAGRVALRTGLQSPGSWYATVNAWHVQARGSYARFVGRVPTGAPDRKPPNLSSVRENTTVRLDVDADGDSEVLGRNRRVTFAAETMVGVAVQP